MQVDEESKENVLFEPEIYRAEDITTASEAQQPSGQAVSNQKVFDSASQIRCCVCGVMTAPNPANTCINCLKQQIDITEGITKTGTLSHCRECNRYLSVTSWKECELESADLLALCLKNMKGLKRVKLLDAKFVWTEPHSRRIKLKLIVEQEVQNNTKLQQTFGVEFVVQNKQCDDCKQTWTPHNWVSQVQVRQRVHHKRTFLFLEQMILKHKAHEKTIGIKQTADGLDFQFKADSHSNRLIQFIKDNFVCRNKHTKQLISHDEQNAEYHYKYTNFCELAPICRDDLVILTPKQQKFFGGIGPLILVYKVTTSVHVVDIKTMQTFEVAAAKYWEHMFTAICSRERLVEFTVVDIHDVDFDVNTSKAAARNKFRMVQITLIKSSEYTNPNRREYIVSTHLGEFLNFNDTVMCYDLGDMAHADLEQFDNSHKTKLPDVVIVKKSYPRVRRRQQKRIWKLERMDIEMTDANDEPRRGKKKAEKESKNDAEYNEFLNDIEEDPELRQNINLFKDEDVIAQLEKQLAGLSLEEGTTKSTLAQAQEKGQIQVGGETRKIATGARKTAKGKQDKAEAELKRKRDKAIFQATLKKAKEEAGSSDEWESVEEDFPHVKLEELMSNLKIDSGSEADD